MQQLNTFIATYLSKLHMPTVHWTDVAEIIILTFLAYHILVWIKNTRAWALLKGVTVIAVFILIAAFAITIIMVYLIRRLSIDYAWTIAMVAGMVVNIMVLLVGDLMFDTNVALFGVIFGNIIAFLLTLVLQFFVFNVDYSRTEKVQFEDDEYYYYVKAVPKVTVAKPEKQVKQINRQRKTKR